ncbi:MAG TPA: hypothetical protein VH019_02290 [Rhizomicrobium sp.]|jgi:hypothetical protein|nr:hypothetical protein [Rhizomicrobium sp.]
MRDNWWELIAERNKRITDVSETEPPFEILEDRHAEGGLRRSRAVLYHRIFSTDDFATAASDIIRLVHGSQKHVPNRRRLLFVDIEGHRQKRGNFDSDMFELQYQFLSDFVIPYVTEIHMPLFSVQNTKAQVNEVPEGVFFMKGVTPKELRRAIAAGVNDIWVASEGASLRIAKPTQTKTFMRTPHKRGSKKRG